MATQFGGDPHVLGQSVRLSGTTYTVIGVAPAWFRFPTAEFQLWTPLRLIEQQAPQAGGEPSVPHLPGGRAS